MVLCELYCTDWRIGCLSNGGVLSGLFSDVLNLQQVGDTATFAAQLLRLVETWREQVLFGLLILECIPVLGILAPGQLALAISGFWAASQPFDVGIRLVLVALAAVLLADFLMFVLGRIGTERVAFLKRTLGQHGSLGRTLEAQSTAVLLLYQFPPYSRMFAPFLLGAGAMRVSAWIPLSIVASVLFVLTYFMIGFSVAWSGQALVESASIASTASAIFALGFFAWLFVFIRQFINLRQRGAKDAE